MSLKKKERNNLKTKKKNKTIHKFFIFTYIIYKRFFFSIIIKIENKI
jgi:hypothetical protein